jgi:hypothetical protein
MANSRLHFLVGLGLIVLGVGRGQSVVARQDQEPPPAPAPEQPPGAEVLTTGPMHEAFAQPVVFDPKPGPVIPKAPPAPVPEMPPEQKPQGDNVQWIPGYWGWDPGRTDFVWVSGFWRAVPPGRQWNPGYWTQVEGGYQWVPGAWISTDQAQLQYLPSPPASLEVGPSAPPPTDDVAWVPGTWMWQDGQYAWRPGFWAPVQPNWMWMPAHYVWTPNGYLFSNGYWDYPLSQRGQLFAPVYFGQPVYTQPGFQYTPTVGLLAGGLLTSLFVSPMYHQYYFGNYYGANYFQSGIYPWYAFHQSRYGYDPVYSYYNVINSRTDPQWSQRLYRDYRYRLDNPEARPARTYNELVRQARSGSESMARSVVYARPIQQIAANSGPTAALRYERLDESRRQTLARRAMDASQFREQRIHREAELARQRPAEERSRPHFVESPRSPIAAPLERHAEAAPHRIAPPPAPEHPRVEREVRPVPHQEAMRLRPEPHPEMKPPPRFEPRQEGGRRR